MYAKVLHDHAAPSIEIGGIVFVKTEWRDVAPGTESEVKKDKGMEWREGSVSDPPKSAANQKSNPPKGEG